MSAEARLATLLLFLSACSNDWRTDMWYQPSHRPDDSPRPEPARSVPLGAGPRYESSDETVHLRNPVPASAASLAHGRALFAARCAPCHGRDGRGDGPVSQFFPPAPDLTGADIQARPDGHLFGIISFGGAVMPPQREGLSERDRWDLVNHVRAIQGRLRVPPP